MNIYEDDGSLDIEKARHELKTSGGVSQDGLARRITAEISAAALLDIAQSLRPLAFEALQALGVTDSRQDDAQPEEPDETPRDFLVVGDLVHLVNDTEPGEVTKVGVSEGEAFADVVFAVRPDEPVRLWAREVERFGMEAVPLTLESIDLEEPDDEIDDDFDTDTNPESDPLVALQKVAKKWKKK